MRHFFIIIFLCVIMSMATAQTIVGTAHDFSATAWTNEICEPCHIPHNADLTVTSAPLWNHQVTVAVFNTYTSPTLDATMGDPKTGNSALCLSCHDGTVALDSFGGVTGTTFMTGTNVVGTNLENDHPVAFTYDTALSATDGGLFDPATQNSGLGGTIQADMLFTNRMECASCHDVHDNTNGKFLRKSNVASALCLTCHNK